MPAPAVVTFQSSIPIMSQKSQEGRWKYSLLRSSSQGQVARSPRMTQVYLSSTVFWLPFSFVGLSDAGKGKCDFG